MTGLLADTYTGDETRRGAALSAANMISTARLRATAEQTRRNEAALASAVDIVAAIQRLNADTLERVNPAIVEAYLTRLASAHVLEVAKTAAGEGILRLAVPGGALPAGLDGRETALIATGGTAITEAQASGAALTNVIPLGPGEPAFADLVSYARRCLAQDTFRGGPAADPTAIADYELFAFEGTIREADGQRTAPWGALIRVDDVGARTVAWESLANLIPEPGMAGAAHPGHVMDAQARAELLAAEDQGKRRQALHAWLTRAERDLRDLPSKISRDIKDRGERISLRASIQQTVRQRLGELNRMAEVTISEVHLTVRLKVKATGNPSDLTEKDSEVIAMRRTRDLLAADGWTIGDVHSEGRGYDLYAVRGQVQRCVEVKGVWSSASSSGVRLTGNEILTATQQRSDYWLYVIDQCSNGVGEIFGVYRDPIAAFGGLIRQEAIFTLPGSALKAAREKTAQT